MSAVHRRSFAELRDPRFPPTFSHDELVELWDAIGELVARPGAPEAVRTAAEKLDRYFAQEVVR